MQERPADQAAPAPVTPRSNTSPAYATPAAKPGVDKFPKTPAEWKTFATLPSVDRAAVYLRSIRSMVMFFTVLTVLGIAATIILMVIGINAANDTTSVNTNPFG